MPRHPFITFSPDLQITIFPNKLVILLHPQFLHRNLRFRNNSAFSKPQLIIAAAHVSHIQAAIHWPQSHNLQIRTRSGSHDFEGLSYISSEYGPDFIVLDLFNLRAVNVSIIDESAWVDAGATLGEVYYRISEKSNIHAFPAGMCPTVGVGGFSNVMRKHGLAADNIVDATLVDVNGRILDRKSMGEDLAEAPPALASSFLTKLKLVKVPRKVTFAPIRIYYYDSKNFTDIVYKYVKIVDEMDEDIYMKLAIDVVEKGDFGIKTLRATFLTLFLEDSRKLVSILETTFPELGLAASDCVDVTWAESLIRWMNFPVGSTTSVLLRRVHPMPVQMKRKSIFLKNPIPKSGLDLVFEKVVELGTPILKFFPFGGIMSEISDSTKPFPHRAGNKALIEITTNWNDIGAEDGNYYINLTRKLNECILPFASKSQEAYLNYRDVDLEVNYNGPNSYYEVAESYGFKYYKNNFDRLVEINPGLILEISLQMSKVFPIFPENIGSA